MSYESEISVVENDFGYDLEFSAVDANDNVIPLNFLSGAVSGLYAPFWFVVWRTTPSGLQWMWRTWASGEFTVVNASGGLFRWQVQSGWFDRVGVYDSECELHYSGMRSITLTDLRVTVVREAP